MSIMYGGEKILVISMLAQKLLHIIRWLNASKELQDFSFFLYKEPFVFEICSSKHVS